jgi:hypothetical protein
MDAVPASGAHVLVRLLRGREDLDFDVNYGMVESE